MHKQLHFIGLILATTLFFSNNHADAQYRLGDGRLLDANTQVGGGGYNPTTPRQTYGRYADAVVTGNVGGLHRFRGFLGYRASGEFSDGTAFDDTYQFQLTSIPPVVRTQQFRGNLTGIGRDTLGGRIGSLGVRGYSTNILSLRSGSGYTSGNLVGYNRFGMSGNVYRDATRRSVADQNRPTSDRMVLPQTFGRVLSLTSDKSGRILEHSVNSLTGVSTRFVSNPYLDALANSQPNTAAVIGNKSMEKDAFQAELASNRHLRSALLVPTLVLGDAIRKSGQPSDARAVDRQIGYRVDSLERGLLRPLGSISAKPGEDVYYDLLRKIRAKSGEDEKSPVKPGNTTPNKDNANTKVKPQKSILQKTQENLAKLREQGKKLDEKRRKERQAQIDELIGKINYDLPPVTTMVGSGLSEFDESIEDAEKMIQKGEYFLAVSAYDKALKAKPKHPMARMGVVHAQLGAGLYLSAGTNLRKVISEHPEIMAARYASTLLPKVERLTKINQNLMEQLSKSSRNDAGLLIAYLGYQQGRPELVSFGISVMKRQNPNDLLIPVIEKIWRKSK